MRCGMRKVTVAVDSFKGSLSSPEIAECVARGIHGVLPDCEVRQVNVADGGEGTMHALVSLMKGELIAKVVSGPLLNPVKAEYFITVDGSTAIMEMASASGLTLIPAEKRNPLKTTTRGVGELILDAVGRGCRKVIVGLGGSATNDGGLGMLTALGFRFLDKDGDEISVGTGADLERIEKVDYGNVTEAIKNTEFVVACDVSNPFCGPDGAARIFARQKGADDEMIERLDRGLRHFAEKIPCLGKIATTPGVGAAGGLGGAFRAFLNADMKSGVEVVLDAIDFDVIIKGSDLIITGEGKLDAQTCMGKAPAGILLRGLAAGIPVIAIGGMVEDFKPLNDAGFKAVFPIQPGPVSLIEAMYPEKAKINIENTVSQIIRLLHIQ